VGLLRGAGNAINKEVAQGFIEAVMDMLGIPASDRRSKPNGRDAQRLDGAAARAPVRASAIVQPLEGSP
jgi:hypothetical protein